jgi:hypothetical protein
MNYPDGQLGWPSVYIANHHGLQEAYRTWWKAHLTHETFFTLPCRDGICPQRPSAWAAVEALWSNESACSYT